MGKVGLLIVGATTSSAGIGGVSIHVERLLHWLTANQVAFDFCDYKKEPLWHVIKQVLMHKVVHIHPSNPLFRVLLVSISKLFGKKVVFTVHGNLGRHSRVKNYMDKLAVRWSDIPVLINKGSYDTAVDWNRQSRLISAYIPPAEDGYIPEYVLERIQEARDEDKIIVSTNASVRSFTNSGEEIYGIDFLIDYFKGRDNYFLCISDPSSQYAAFYAGRDFENVLFITESHSFYALMRHSDVMVRATATDGDSLSIREGLDLNIKVIATDRVDRPDGVVLFKYRDSLSFESALSSSSLRVDSSNDNTIEELIRLYNSLL